MNRHERRATGKAGTPPPQPAANANAGYVPTSRPPDASAAAARPSFLLRAFSRVLLSQWVIARVDNPQVEQLLMSLAMEAKRPEVADQILRRRALRAHAGR